MQPIPILIISMIEAEIPWDALETHLLVRDFTLHESD